MSAHKFWADIYKKSVDNKIKRWYNISRVGDRGIAQLVERRSPKPYAEGSIPSAPAKKSTCVCKCFLFYINVKFIDKLAVLLLSY